MVRKRKGGYRYDLADDEDNDPEYVEETEVNDDSYVEETEEPINGEDGDYAQPQTNDDEEAPSNEMVMDYTDVFTNGNYFVSREALQEWVRVVSRQHNMVIIVKRSDNGSGKKKAHVLLACERGGVYRKFKGRGKSQIVLHKDSIDVDLDEEEKHSKRNTGSKKCGCPFLLKGIKISPTEWRLDVKNGRHNHPVALYLEGHSYVGRLTPEEEQLVVDMSKCNAPPKDVLMMIKLRNPDNHSTLRTIYNARNKYKLTEYAGRSQLQQLMTLLIDHQYFHSHRSCSQTNTLRELFFAHPTGIQLFRAFPSVLIMDCTYKTNRYKMPYLEMVGITSTGMTFSVASVYLEREKEENYTWALGVLREILNDACLPRVVLTDRELALMNAVTSIFPTATHFLCSWHINRNVLAKCKEKFDTKDAWDRFFHTSWKNVVDASSFEQFEEVLRYFHDEYANVPIEREAYEYCMNSWVNPYKEKFVAAWTDEIMHYENLTTNRVEGHHAALKRSLGNSMGNFEGCWAKTHTLYEASHNAVKASFEKSVNVALHKFKSVLYRDLRGVVSIYALEKMYKEMSQIENGESNPLICNHYLRKVCGLPCTHELDEYHRLGKPIPLDVIDKFWRKLDMEPLLRDVNDVKDDVDNDLDSRFEDLIQGMVVRYKTEETSQKRVLYRQALEWHNPATTTLLEPEPKVNTRGRPKSKSKWSKKKEDTSTKRDPSEFEYKEHLPFSGISVEDDVVEVSPKIKKTTSAPSRPGYRKRTRSVSKVGLIDLLPTRFHPRIMECKDVVSDGHCGYRAVAALMGYGEEQWARIRQTLMNELGRHMPMYKDVFRANSIVDEMLHALNCFTPSAGFDHWFQTPYNE